MSIKKGFTLVELLVAISIIAVLSVIGLTAYNGVQARARDSKRMDDLKRIQTALELYHNDNGSYPQTGWLNSHSGGFWITGLDAKYIDKMPVDPKQASSDCNLVTVTTCYTYTYYSGPSFDGFSCVLNGVDDGYILAARLESHSGSDLSQQTYYKLDGTQCGKWTEDPGVPGLYVVRNP